MGIGRTSDFQFIEPVCPNETRLVAPGLFGRTQVREVKYLAMSDLQTIADKPASLKQSLQASENPTARKHPKTKQKK